MRKILIAFVLLATPAAAQQPQGYEPVTATLLNKALECEAVAGQRLAGAQQQVQTLMKELAEAKEKLKAAAPAAP